jgi:hypothetical protein
MEDISEKAKEYVRLYAERLLSIMLNQKISLENLTQSKLTSLRITLEKQN